MSSPKGYSSQEKDDRLSAQFQTIEPVRELQYGSSVVAHQFVFEVGTDAAEAGSSSSAIVATGHAALKGDVIRLTSGALSGREVKVWEVSANLITLAETLPSAVAAAVTFQILRHKYPTVDSSGSVNVNAVIAEEALSPDGGALPAQLKVAGGYDGTNVQVLKTDAAGELQVDVLSSALPAGAATEATVSTLATEATLNALINMVATELTLNSINISASAIANCVDVAELQVDVVSSALPSGAATEATLSTLATESTVSQLALGSTQTDGTQKTQIVDGSGNVIGSTGNALDVNVKTPITIDVQLSEANDSVAVFGSDGAVNRALKTDANGELQVDVLSSALPTGAATEASLLNVATSANQTNGTQKSQIVDGAGDIADVVLLNTALQGTDKGLVTNTIIHGETTGGGGGYVDVKVTPSGAMVTETSIASIADVDGQQAMAASFPVVIASDQSAIPVTDNGSSLTVDGTVAVSAISAALPAGTNTIGKVDVNTLSVVDLLDAGILDTSSTNIAGSASNPTQVVATLAAAVKKIQLLDTTGAFIGVYTGAALSEVLQLVMGPGSDQTIEHSISAGTRISLKRLDSTSAVSSGIVAINFIG